MLIITIANNYKRKVVIKMTISVRFQNDKILNKFVTDFLQISKNFAE